MGAGHEGAAIDGLIGLFFTAARGIDTLPDNSPRPAVATETRRCTTRECTWLNC